MQNINFIHNNKFYSGIKILLPGTDKFLCVYDNYYTDTNAKYKKICRIANIIKDDKSWKRQHLVSLLYFFSDRAQNSMELMNLCKMWYRELYKSCVEQKQQCPKILQIIKKSVDLINSLPFDDVPEKIKFEYKYPATRKSLNVSRLHRHYFTQMRIAENTFIMEAWTVWKTKNYNLLPVVRDSIMKLWSYIYINTLINWAEQACIWNAVPLKKTYWIDPDGNKFVLTVPTLLNCMDHAYEEIYPKYKPGVITWFCKHDLVNSVHDQDTLVHMLGLMRLMQIDYAADVERPFTHAVIPDLYPVINRKSCPDPLEYYYRNNDTRELDPEEFSWFWPELDMSGVLHKMALYNGKDGFFKLRNIGGKPTVLSFRKSYLDRCRYFSYDDKSESVDHVDDGIYQMSEIPFHTKWCVRDIIHNRSDLITISDNTLVTNKTTDIEPAFSYKDIMSNVFIELHNKSTLSDSNSMSGYDYVMIEKNKYDVNKVCFSVLSEFPESHHHQREKMNYTYACIYQHLIRRRLAYVWTDEHTKEYEKTLEAFSMKKLICYPCAFLAYSKTDVHAESYDNKLYELRRHYGDQWAILVNRMNMPFLELGFVDQGHDMSSEFPPPGLGTCKDLVLEHTMKRYTSGSNGHPISFFKKNGPFLRGFGEVSMVKKAVYEWSLLNVLHHFNLESNLLNVPDWDGCWNWKTFDIMSGLMNAKICVITDNAVVTFGSQTHANFYVIYIRFDHDVPVEFFTFAPSYDNMVDGQHFSVSVPHGRHGRYIKNVRNKWHHVNDNPNVEKYKVSSWVSNSEYLCYGVIDDHVKTNHLGSEIYMDSDIKIMEYKKLIDITKIGFGKCNGRSWFSDILDNSSEDY
ncbi:hypothetical protein [Salmon gill poxvirus]